MLTTPLGDIEIYVSLIATTSYPSAPNICLNARRPIRPKPLIATLTAIINLPPKNFSVFIILHFSIHCKCFYKKLRTFFL